MQVALFATALAILVYLLRRAVLARRSSARSGESAAAREPPGCLELVGFPLPELSIDGRTFRFLGVTALAPRGFSHVPPGRHRVVVLVDGEARGVEAIVRPGALTRIVCDERGAVLALQAGAAPVAFDASYIHFPTWLRGPRLLLAVSHLEDA